MPLLLNILIYINGALIVAAGISAARCTWDQSPKDVARQQRVRALAQAAFGTMLAYLALSHLIWPNTAPSPLVNGYMLTCMVIAATGLWICKAKRRTARAQRSIVAQPELAVESPHDGTVPNPAIEPNPSYPQARQGD